MHSTQSYGKAGTTRRWVGDTADAPGEQEPTTTAAMVAKKSSGSERVTLATGGHAGDTYHML